MPHVAHLKHAPRWPDKLLWCTDGMQKFAEVLDLNFLDFKLKKQDEVLKFTTQSVSKGAESNGPSSATFARYAQFFNFRKAGDMFDILS